MSTEVKIPTRIVIEVFAVFDAKAGLFGNPWLAQNAGVAARSFSQQVSAPESNILKNPEDFFLYHLGSYELNSGKLEPLTAPLSLGCATQYIQPKQ